MELPNPSKWLHHHFSTAYDAPHNPIVFACGRPQHRPPGVRPNAPEELPRSKVSCETCSKTNRAMDFGKITTKATADCKKIICDTCDNINFVPDHVDADNCMVWAVHGHFIKRPEEINIDGQCHMFEYANDENPECMPRSHVLATKLGACFIELRKNIICVWLRPNGKALFTVKYRNYDGVVAHIHVHTVLISIQTPLRPYKLTLAQQVFDEMSDRSHASWNAFVDVFAASGECGSALQLFRTMMPILITFACIPLLLIGGIVDGRNIWANGLAASLATLQDLESIVGKNKLVISTSCSLVHTTVGLVNETKLDDEMKSWLAFVAQKVGEVNVLAKALAGSKDEAFFSANA